MKTLLIFLGYISVIIAIVIDEIKPRKPRNKIHFYIQRDGYGIFHLSIGRLTRESKLGLWMPIRGKSCRIASSNTYIPYFKELNLSFPEHKNLKWEDEPVEIYLNLID